MPANVRLGPGAKNGADGRPCQPCSQGFDRDAGTVSAVTANLVGKRGDVDRLAEEPGETGGLQPIVISRIG